MWEPGSSVLSSIELKGLIYDLREKDLLIWQLWTSSTFKKKNNSEFYIEVPHKNLSIIMSNNCKGHLTPNIYHLEHASERVFPQIDIPVHCHVRYALMSIENMKMFHRQLLGTAAICLPSTLLPWRWWSQWERRKVSLKETVSVPEKWLL